MSDQHSYHEEENAYRDVSRPSLAYPRENHAQHVYNSDERTNTGWDIKQNRVRGKPCGYADETAANHYEYYKICK